MEKSKKDQPYSELGNFIKLHRQKFNESLQDVSSAIEIEPSDLEKIELGQDRPSEDILILLINHFNLKDNEALSLWKMANYDDLSLLENMPYTTQPKNDIISATNIVMLMPVDARAIYSDHFEVVVGQSGLVLNFNQTVPNNQTIPVSKIGVSLEQAGNILKALQSALLSAKYKSEPKRLNPPKNLKDPDNK